jgi:Tol biopolymer transport system component
MDRALADWLREGPEHGPREGLERALAATRRTSQRPGWTFPERWLPMQLSMARTPSMRPLLTIVTIALLVLALAAAAVLIGSSRRELPPPFGVARNGAVVFERDGDILIADALDGTERPLVAGPETDTYPVISNQGDRIAFLRTVADGGFRLMSANIDGSAVTELGQFPTNDGIRWSPDGSALLMNYTNNGNFTGLRLAVVRADGSGVRELDFGMTADYGSWRPDGRQIVFRGQPGDRTGKAFIADADGTNVRQLAIPTSELTDLEGLGWSPDGTRLSFMSSRTPPDIGWQIGIADIDAAGSVTDLRRLKFDQDALDEMLPAWSPDSTYLAFQMEKEGINQVAIAKADGSGLRMVGPTTRDRDGLDYAWAPDGRTLLIASPYGETSMWSIDAASGDATEMGGTWSGIPAWQRLAQ